MAKAMDDRFFVQLQKGEEIRVIPWEDEPFLVTHVFLVDPQSAAGQGVVAACVEMGTQKITIAQLSSDMPAVELETQVLLDEEFCLYVTRSGGDAHTDTEEDAVIVQFEGFVLVPDEESDEDDGEDEDATSSEDDDESTDEESEEEDEEDNEEDEETDVEYDRDVASSPGGNAKDV